ncbi:MAG TPA: HDIG domain-containing metalloprotein [Thermosynechococcaceae cyanobacterium]
MKLQPWPHSRFKRLKLRASFILAVTIVALTCAVGQRFYNAPKLDIGKAATETIYAPATATVEDPKVTDDRRKAARKDAASVLMLDQAVSQRVQQSLQQKLNQGSELRRSAGPFPFTKSTVLSVPAQVYLRQSEETDWQAILSALPGSNSPPDSSSPPSNPGRQQAIAELQAYQQVANLEEYFALVQVISQTRFRYAAALKALRSPDSAAPPLYDSALLTLSEDDWQQTQTKTLQIAEEMLAQGLPLGLPTEIVQVAIELRVKNALAEPGRAIAVSLLLNSLEPNLVRDEAQTRQKADQAALEIKPELVKIRRGEVIVRSGETISSADFALLDHFGLSRRGTDWWGLSAFGALVSGAVGLCGGVAWKTSLKLRRRDRLLLLLLTLTTPLLLLLRVPGTNLTAVGLLVSTFYGAPLAIAVSGLLALLLAIGMPVSWVALLPSAASGLLASALAGRLRSREELTLLAVGVGVLQGALYLLLNVASGPTWYRLLGASTIQALLGLGWCIVAIGTSPFLEQGFDLVTTSRLVELANPNRPLLKRLAAEAPGTFQHTLFVANLAEAAARALNCNVELTRAGTLYHDIGKMHDPLGFIENQRGLANKHDQINDPWISAIIIKKHVSEGLVLARRHRLPKEVQTFIPEHQGTMLIAYFYHQAQQRVEVSTDAGSPIAVLNDADFRYDGPAPQSRETGIVMLADSCEAALRSLKDATPEAALSMINKILRARWQDNQLAGSGLTREDLTKIATVFVDVWQQSNHQRIAYPKLNFP